MLSIVIPTLNERKNIDLNIKLLSKLLYSIKYEIIFVDDNSTDGTFDYCQLVGEKDPLIRSILREDRKGLSSAVVEGILSSRYPIVCVVDADLQYDMTGIPKAFALIKSNKYDLVIMTRTMLNDKSKTNLSKFRLLMTTLSSKLSGYFISGVKDPNSGFFLVRKKLILDELNNLSKIGFKILLDFLMSCKNNNKQIKIYELDTSFNDRLYGESKLNLTIFVDLVEMFIDKLSFKLIPGSFVLFLFSGLTGFLMQIYALTFLINIVTSKNEVIFFTSSLAMLLNFYLNNEITFRKNKLKMRKFYYGAFKFFIVCSVGFLININIQEHLNSFSVYTFALSTLVASFWNYSVSKNFVWRVK